MIVVLDIGISFGEIFVKALKSLEMRTGSGLILGLNTEAGGSRGDIKDEVDRWLEVLYPFLE
jgi:hypothetical protein